MFEICVKRSSKTLAFLELPNSCQEYDSVLSFESSSSLPGVLFQRNLGWLMSVQIYKSGYTNNQASQAGGRWSSDKYPSTCIGKLRGRSV